MLVTRKRRCSWPGPQGGTPRTTGPLATREIDIDIDLDLDIDLDIDLETDLDLDLDLDILYCLLAHIIIRILYTC